MVLTLSGDSPSRMTASRNCAATVLTLTCVSCERHVRMSKARSASMPYVLSLV